ncbi:hypothetical protein OUZ56_026485 [Daphnia magna]|uniref:Uncharacterized protein n=1 Tax=Daphnia magna TaxID=35525 RepID=A0ABQ9ZLX4_9CRUS|nr:hypothetical protein OUZ56_026485 [Daphnia magna]
MLRKYMDQGFPKWEGMLVPELCTFLHLGDTILLIPRPRPNDAIDQFLLAPSTNTITPSDYKSQIMQRLHEAFLLVNDNLVLAREQQRAQYDNCAQQQEFRVGDKVLIDVRRPMSGTSRKLIPRFMGPFLIVKVNDNHTLEMQECAGKQTQLVHVNRIKPLYESMIWKEEPCVEFEDNHKEDTSPNLTHEPDLTATIEEEHPEGRDQRGVPPLAYSQYHPLLCTYKRALNKGSAGGTGSMPEGGHRADSLKITRVSTKN